VSKFKRGEKLTEKQKKRIEKLPQEARDNLLKDYDEMIKQGYTPQEVDLEIRIMCAEGLFTKDDASRLLLILLKGEAEARVITSEQRKRINKLPDDIRSDILNGYQFSLSRGKRPLEFENELWIMRAEGKIEHFEVIRIVHMKNRDK
jgi:hypothetical protein